MSSSKARSNLNCHKAAMDALVAILLSLQLARYKSEGITTRKSTCCLLRELHSNFYFLHKREL